MYHFRKIPINQVAWDQLDKLGDRTIFQTREWLTFLQASTGAEPVVAEILDGSQTVGHFTGMVVQKFGIKILGSPLEGWTTYTMGMNLLPGASKLAANKALVEFAFDELGCIHIELCEDSVDPDAYTDAGFIRHSKTGWEAPLFDTSEKLLANWSRSGRRDFRRGEQCGVIIREAQDVEFAVKYYDQFKDVMAYDGTSPTFPLKRVQDLITHLQPTGRLLLLRAFDQQGTWIASGIFPAMNGIMYGWGQVSYRKHLDLFPNPVLFHHAMLYWGERGMTRFVMGAGGFYKHKYGAQTVVGDRYMKSRFKSLIHLRKAAQKIFHFGLRSRAFVLNHANSKPAQED